MSDQHTHSYKKTWQTYYDEHGLPDDGDPRSYHNGIIHQHERVDEYEYGRAFKWVMAAIRDWF